MEAQTFAGDIGDTKTDMVIDSGEFWPHTPLAPTEVCRADYARLKETVEEFLAEVQTSIDVASCDVAGPGINGRVKITDLLWASDEATLTTDLSLKTVHLPERNEVYD